MSNSIPDNIGQKIKDSVYREADKFNYLAKSRTENGKFLDKLLKMPQIGGIISQYIEKGNIRTYIKDAILNRYTKDKQRLSKPTSYIKIVKETFNLPDDSTLLQESNNIHIIKSVSSKSFVIVTLGTYLKWETALRKALLYLAKAPFFKDNQNQSFILLSLYARGQRIPDSDKKLLNSALTISNAKAYIWGEK